MTEFSTLGQQTLCLRCFSWDGMEVANIHFFKDNEIKLSCKKWMEKVYDTKALDDKKHIYQSDIRELMQIETPVKKLKVDLNMKKNFYTKGTKDEYEYRLPNEKFYDLYLYIDGENVQVEFEKQIVIETEETTRTEFETVNVYKVFIKGLANPVTIAQVIERKYVKTDFGNRLAELQKELEDLRIDISGYYLQKLLEHYDVVKRV